MKKKSSWHMWLAVAQILLLPVLAWYGIYDPWLAISQGKVEAARRAWLYLVFYVTWPRNLITLLTIVALLPVWWRESGKKRWCCYAFLMFLSFFFPSASGIVLSRSCSGSLLSVRNLVPWVWWVFLMVFLYWNEFDKKGENLFSSAQQEKTGQP